MNNNIYKRFGFDWAQRNILFKLDNGKSFSYQDIDEKVSQYCHFFESIGLKQGDRIAQQTEKCVDSICIYLASLKFGAIYVPLNPAYQEPEVMYFITDVRPSLFICCSERLYEIQEIAKKIGVLLKIETLSEKSNGSVQNKSKSLPKSFEIFQSRKSDIACILYTSGTTGQPKGAMLSHENLIENGLALKKLWEFTENDVLLHMLPIFHCHGLFFSTHCVLLSGASIIFLPKLDIDCAIKHLPFSTVMMAVPTYYTRLLNDARFTKDLTKNIRLFISGSAPLLEKTFYEFEKRTGQKILERYGMTETGINTSNPIRGDRLPGSIGTTLSHTSLRIVDDNDQEIERNKAGHIQVKGPNVFSGYWEKTEKTRESFTQDGFFRTGDIGVKSNDDYISIVGRAKDMIITGGLNVYPSEIELTINRIEGVKESAIIGLPHADFGEAVTAVIVLYHADALSSDTIISAIKNSLANYKIPKKVIFVNELPKNAMGKVQKNILRAEYSNLYF